LSLLSSSAALIDGLPGIRKPGKALKIAELSCVLVTYCTVLSRSLVRTGLCRSKGKIRDVQLFMKCAFVVEQSEFSRIYRAMKVIKSACLLHFRSYKKTCGDQPLSINSPEEQTQIDQLFAFLLRQPTSSQVEQQKNMEPWEGLYIVRKMGICLKFLKSMEKDKRRCHRLPRQAQQYGTSSQLIADLRRVLCHTKTPEGRVLQG